MIDHINGILDYKTLDAVIVDVNGIGYKIYVSVSSFEKLPDVGNKVEIYIVEAVSGIYGGVICLYGFLSQEERDMYMMIKEEVPGTGAKKAMEYLDKISKSATDFKTAVMSKNAAMLHDIFGFTKKTADKLVTALKDKISSVNVSGKEKWQAAAYTTKSDLVSEAIAGLIALGYKESQARNAVNKSYSENEKITLEELIKKSLQQIG
ncbi:MAG: Holliday junction branch migration protein RuvA [Endomicrobium sp.]|nr:Holliday junction branch migration protein RuvA [Endomicrobium sp.]